MPKSLWRKFVVSIHGGRGKWVFLPADNGSGGCWKSIVSLLRNITFQQKSLHSFFRGSVGRGDIIRFWTDLWYGTSGMFGKKLLRAFRSFKLQAFKKKLLLNKKPCLVEGAGSF